jgi:hypothetical protein
MSVQKLFGENYLAAFNEGYAANFVLKRNRNLGVLLTSERGIFYVQILFRMLYFRKEHELEPLNDEIFYAVKGAQELHSEFEYTLDIFSRDMRQLSEWDIITRRIEKNRLRGYKDISREKFRYTLRSETVSFLNWMEESLQSDIEDRTVDTRNFLVDFLGRLKETVRSLGRLEKEDSSEEQLYQEAASVVYNINLLDHLTLSVSSQLAELNTRLLSFLFSSYKLEDAKNAIVELEFYSSIYLKQVDKYRRDIIFAIKKITESESTVATSKICNELAVEYYRKLPFMAEKKPFKQRPLQMIISFEKFYGPSGKLDLLCRRINDTAIKVWGKLSAYLRELERKNTRLDDIRSRINEISTFNEDAAFDTFFFELLASAQMVTDSNYWKDGFEKANPPLPRMISDKKIKEPKHFFKKKKKETKAPVQTLEQMKLEKLKDWIERRKCDNLVSKWNFDSFEDFSKIIELARYGILNDGKKLKKLDLKLEVESQEAKVEAQKAQLRFNDMILKQK